MCYTDSLNGFLLAPGQIPIFLVGVGGGGEVSEVKEGCMFGPVPLRGPWEELGSVHPMAAGFPSCCSKKAIT